MKTKQGRKRSQSGPLKALMLAVMLIVGPASFQAAYARDSEHGSVYSETFHPNAKGYWRGVEYTPRGFHRGTWCGLDGRGNETNACPMCKSLRTQWRRDTAKIRADMVSTKFHEDNPKQDDVEKYPTSEYDKKYRTETYYVTETRTEQAQRKVCEPIGLGFRTRCYYVYADGSTSNYSSRQKSVRVKKTRQVAYYVRKAPPTPEPDTSITIVQKSKQRLLPTPAAAIRRLMSHLKPASTDIVIDAGSGDGRFLIEASSRGCQAIGVELNPDMVKLSRQRIRQSGSRALVFQGDATEFDYSQADIVYIYQFPDLAERIVRRIPRDRRRVVVSYMHPIPGVKSTTYKTGDGSVFHIGVVGETAVEKGSTALTFGL